MMVAMALAKTVEPRDTVDLDRMAESARGSRRLLKALAHKSRLLILCNLLGGEKSVGELEAFLDLRQSTVSQQLARLRLEGLVASRRDGPSCSGPEPDRKFASRSATRWSPACSFRSC